MRDANASIGLTGEDTEPKIEIPRCSRRKPVWPQNGQEIVNKEIEAYTRAPPALEVPFEMRKEVRRKVKAEENVVRLCRYRVQCSAICSKLSDAAVRSQRGVAVSMIPTCEHGMYRQIARFEVDQLSEKRPYHSLYPGTGIAPDNHTDIDQELSFQGGNRWRIPPLPGAKTTPDRRPKGWNHGCGGHFCLQPM